MLDVNYFKGVLSQIKRTEDSSLQKERLGHLLYAASVRQQFSFIDQENVEATVEQWALKNPQDRFFFRPHSLTKEADATDGANHVHLADDDDNQKDDDVTVSSRLQPALWMASTLKMKRIPLKIYARIY